MVLDRKQRVVHANQSTELLLATSECDLIGQSCFDAVPAVDSQTGLPCANGCPVFGSNQYQWAHSRRLMTGAGTVQQRRIECLLLRCAVPSLNATLVFLGDRDADDPWGSPSEIEATQSVLPALLGTRDVDHAARLVISAAVEATGASSGSIRVVIGDSGKSGLLGYTHAKGEITPGLHPENRLTSHQETSRLHLPVLETTTSVDSNSTVCLSVCVPLLADDRLLGTIQVEGPTNEFQVGAAIRALYPLATQLSAFLRWSTALSTGLDTAKRLKITSLGRFRIQVDDVDVPHNAFTRKRGLELLRRLASTNRGGLSREEIIECLWGDAPPASANQNLRVVIHSLKRALEPELASGMPSAFIEIDGERVKFIRESVDIDVDEFLERHQRCLALADLGYQKEAIRVGSQAVDLYGGPFMEDEEYSDWCMGQRARLAEVYLDLVSLIGSLHEETGQLERAIQMYQRALLIEPAFESAHRSLMRAFVAAGRQDDAIRQYAVCAESLWTALGVSPSVETEALRKSMNRTQSDLAEATVTVT